MKHKHHIIPKHAGGTDEDSNIIELTVEEHAEAHRLLFEQYGRWQDRLAWLALSGRIGKEEIIRIRWKKKWEKRRENGNDKSWNAGLSLENTDKYKESLKKLSDGTKRAMKAGLLNNIGDVVRGKKLSPERRAKLSEIVRSRKKKVCYVCNAIVSAPMLKRWHGLGKCDLTVDIESLKMCRVCSEQKPLKLFVTQGVKLNGQKKYGNTCHKCAYQKRKARESK